jgi:putative mRNA 3-end processing factor
MDEGCVEIDGEIVKVNMQVEQYDFSAHAGDSELKGIVSKFYENGTGIIFTVHGDDTEGFATWAREEYGCDAISPKVGEEFIIE